MSRTSVAETSMLDALPSGAAIVDDAGTPVWVNHVGEYLLGLSGAQAAVRGLFSSDRSEEHTSELQSR